LKQEIKYKKVGEAEDVETDLGSLAAERQLTLLEDQVKDALDKGAVVVV